MHPLPPVLTPGPGSLNTLIGFLPAWRAIPTAAAAGVQAAKQAADIAVQVAEAATLAAAGTPGAPAAYAAEQATKAATLASMSSMIAGAACGADIHACVTPSPVPPHGPGVVIDGSPTVLINNLPASRMGDTIIEPLGPPNKIMMGCPTVIIGQSGSGCSISGGGGGGGGAAGASSSSSGGAGGGAGAAGPSSGSGGAPAGGSGGASGAGAGGSGGASGGAPAGSGGASGAGAGPFAAQAQGPAANTVKSLADAAKSAAAVVVPCEDCQLGQAAGTHSPAGENPPQRGMGS